MKYIIIDNGGIESAVLFDELFEHAQFGLGRKVVAAGFVSPSNFACSGKSVSLEVGSRPEKDREVIFDTLNRKAGHDVRCAACWEFKHNAIQDEDGHVLCKQERDALKVEYESRAIWIAKMNKILGYDNSDGFHSEPGPHEIAETLVAEHTGYKGALQRILSYPVHSEPVGGAMAMQDIAHEAMNQKPI